MNTTAQANPLVKIQDYGQSIWFDNIRRALITSGELQRLIDEDGLRGVTSNPAIFEKAITGSTDYRSIIERLRTEGEQDAKALYERLAIGDIQDAADILRPVYERTERRDGYISFEVAPALAHDTDGTIAEAERLWLAVDRPNLMIKVPATPEGVPAIRHLIGAGINVNVTLLFSQAAYEQVAEAFISGLEAHAQDCEDLGHVASVASFFISRIDSAVDSRLSELAGAAKTERQRALARSLLGEVAIANAKLTYQRYLQLFAGERWQALAAQGAQTQRLLWASTSTKNPAYTDVLYVEQLIGPDTVNTVPPATFDAFRAHGNADATLQSDTERAAKTMTSLDQVGVSFTQVTDQLLDDAVRLFAEAFDKLLGAVEATCATDAPLIHDRMSRALGEQEAAVSAALSDWDSADKVARLWAHDASLWTGQDEGAWLGWLGIAEDQRAHATELATIAADARDSGFSTALLLGMGGSSLCPEMLALSFGKQEGHPQLLVLDSTDPEQVKSFADRIKPAETLFIISSKSGSTLEPNIFEEYFLQVATDALGPDEAPEHFIAVTDPGSKLERLAQEAGFRRIAHGVKSIGGRYSALSNFGMVPGAVMGVDVQQLLERADRMAKACASCVPAADNPGLVLGTILGVSATHGRDKITLIASPTISDLGAWLEQLMAESTGKQGKGLVPVDLEPLGDPAVYGDDRLFVYLHLDGHECPDQERAVTALEQAGLPVVRIGLSDVYDLGREIFRWEFATAVVGAIIGINAFDQPDVEASKLVTRELTGSYEQTGSLPSEMPILIEGDIRLFADEANAESLTSAATDGGDVADLLRAHIARVGAGDYIALLAYLPMTATHRRRLQAMRERLRDSTRAATVLGFGPRFLHSTGQAYKGGPNSGVFLQITCDDARDLPIPGHKYTFGVVKAAQARGDLEVLVERGRRALRIHLADLESGLSALEIAIDKALA